MACAKLWPDYNQNEIKMKRIFTCFSIMSSLAVCVMCACSHHFICPTNCPDLQLISVWRSYLLLRSNLTISCDVVIWSSIGSTACNISWSKILWTGPVSSLLVQKLKFYTKLDKMTFQTLILCDPFCHWFRIWYLKSYKNSLCLHHDSTDVYWSQICTGHDSSAVVTCAELWPDLIIIYRHQCNTTFYKIQMIWMRWDLHYECGPCFL